MNADLHDAPGLDPRDEFDPSEEVQFLNKKIETLTRGLADVAGLMDESYGIAGLHLNGDVAPWGELRRGGRYEDWLSDFEIALNTAGLE